MLSIILILKSTMSRHVRACALLSVKSLSERQYGSGVVGSLSPAVGLAVRVVGRWSRTVLGRRACGSLALDTKNKKVHCSFRALCVGRFWFVG